MLMSVIVKIIMPISLGYIIQSFEMKSEDGYYWALLLVACNLYLLFEHHHVFYINWHYGMKLRIAIVAAIFSKSLRLKSSGHASSNGSISKKENDKNSYKESDDNEQKESETTFSYTGQAMNLVSNDADRFVFAPLFLPNLFWSPVQAIATLIVGVHIIGYAFAIGVGLLLCLFMPLQFYLMKRFAILRSKVAKMTDSRVTLISQVISGVRTMKMSGWECEFQRKIAKIRHEEIAQIQKANRLKAINEAVYFFVNIFISTVIFLIQVLHNSGSLNPRNVFTVVSFINILQLEVAKHFSLGIMGGSECWVSIRRIQKFLELPELVTKKSIANNNSHNDSKDGAVTMCCHNHGVRNIATHINIEGISLMKENNLSIESYESELKSETSVSLGKNEGNFRKEDRGDNIHGAKDADNDEKEVEEDQQYLQNNIALSLSGVCCNWSENDTPKSVVEKNDCSEDYSCNTVALSNINLNLSMNSITCIIGSVGSGKSALLLTLAGELQESKGHISRQYSCLAYASQDPWIMNGTVRENILMGLAFNESFYLDIVNACGLVHDFAQFQKGEETIVGDRGVQCSGGQRARIGLARALYRDSEVLLLDDPLSAVDSKVGRLIFYSAIQGLAVKRGKCVVLVTHQHQYLGDIRCILMSAGKIKKIGSFVECVAASDDKLHLVSYNAAINHDHKKLTPNSFGVGGDYNKDKKPKKESVEDNPLHPIDLHQEESKNDGIVKMNTFLFYARATGGVWLATVLIFLFLITQVASLLSVMYCGRWSELPPEEQVRAVYILIGADKLIFADFIILSFISLFYFNQNTSFILHIVLALGVSVVVLSFMRALICFALTVKASKRLHDSMTHAILRAKVEFFDINPSGRILNRFSADVGSNDDLLPTTLFDFLVCSFMVLGAIVTVVVALPLIFIIIPPLLWYFLATRRTFVTSSRELRRLDGLARSPIFSMLNESMCGLATIRANHAVAYFKEKFELCHDAHSRVFYAFLGASRWIGFKMDSIVFIINGSAIFLSVFLSERDWFAIDPIVLGLALSMLIHIGGLFQWTVRISAEVVNQMVAVERVSEYSSLPPEAPLVTDADSGSYDWPQSGSIEVSDLALRYRSTLPLVLKGISFQIKSGERVGVVGRTGSGKSTLVQALFRVLEAEQGKIIIDDVDISRLGLHKLRRGISVVNQYPVLFSGCTIRENLDPFEKYDNLAIREALADVQMIKLIDELPDGLNSVVDDGGSNFSVGERQLLCLARAILRKSKILVLDEPTANVDSRTDKLLQEAVSKSFSGATIISVAHRLDTIIEYDMVLILGDGFLLEFGTPADLLSKDSHFAGMVDDTGKEMSFELRRRAKERSKKSN